MQEMENGRIFHGTGPRNHLSHLRNFRCNKDRHIREKQSNKVVTLSLMLPELAGINITQLHHIFRRKTDQLMRPMRVIFHNIGERSGLNGFWMRSLKVIALEIAVIGDLPVRAMNDAVAHISPIIHPLGGYVVHHLSEVGPDIDIALWIQNREDQSTFLMARERH